MMTGAEVLKGHGVRSCAGKALEDSVVCEAFEDYITNEAIFSEVKQLTDDSIWRRVGLARFKSLSELFAFIKRTHKGSDEPDQQTVGL